MHNFFKYFLPFLIVVFLTGCAADVSNPNDITIPTSSETYAAVSPTEPTSPTVDPIVVYVSNMTLEEKVGQLFLARCPDVNAISDVQAYHLGGYILFARDFEYSDPMSLKQTVDSYQAAADTPMLIAVDEEGGTVCRVSAYSAFRDARFSSPRKLYNSGGMDAIITEETEKCILLYNLGINVNMAPVCDIATDKQAFMYSRALGQNAAITAEYTAVVTALMADHKIGSVLKHFPGYGNNTDTHTAIAVDRRSMEELTRSDLIPFQAGIHAGCGAILVSHTVVEAIDPDLPASLSPSVHDYLRGTMQFSGVIITDDTEMKAITKRYGDAEAAVLAIAAGNDMICTGSYAVQHPAIVEAVRAGRLSEAQIDASVCRILRWKEALGIFSPPKPN